MSAPSAGSCSTATTSAGSVLPWMRLANGIFGPIGEISILRIHIGLRQRALHHCVEPHTGETATGREFEDFAARAGVCGRIGEKVQHASSNGTPLAGTGETPTNACARCGASASAIWIAPPPMEWPISAKVFQHKHRAS